MGLGKRGQEYANLNVRAHLDDTDKYTELEAVSESLNMHVESLSNDLRGRITGAQCAGGVAEGLPVDSQLQKDGDDLAAENATLNEEKRDLMKKLTKANDNLAEANGNVTNHVQPISQLETDTQDQGAKVKTLVVERNELGKERDTTREQPEEPIKANKIVQAKFSIPKTANPWLTEQTKSIPGLKNRETDTNKRRRSFI